MQFSSCKSKKNSSVYYWPFETLLIIYFNIRFVLMVGLPVRWWDWHGNCTLCSWAKVSSHIRPRFRLFNLWRWNVLPFCTAFQSSHDANFQLRSKRVRRISRSGNISASSVCYISRKWPCQFFRFEGKLQNVFFIAFAPKFSLKLPWCTWI